MQQGYAAVLCEYSWGTGGMASGVTSVGVPEGADATGFGCPGVLAVLGLEAAAPGECELTRLLQDKLQYEMRLQYMVTPALGEGGHMWHCRAPVCSRGDMVGAAPTALQWPGGGCCVFYQGQFVPSCVQSYFFWGLTTSKAFSPAPWCHAEAGKGVPITLPLASPHALPCLSRNTTFPSTTQSRSSTKRC